jgi:hypothetical protein
MDWDKFLIKKAKRALNEITDFQSVIYKPPTHILIKIKNGKFELVTTERQKNDYRTKSIKKFLEKIDLSDNNDCVIPLRTSDSYEKQSDFCFSWAKPASKKGLLFPCWSFDNWEETVKEFDMHYIPWESRIEEPYFRGKDSTIEGSNLRKIVQNFYPDNITLNDSTINPVTDLMKYKVAFDLPGGKPWSVRTPYIDLSGCASLRILHYYPRWNETPWIQFYEDDKDLNGIPIEGNYNAPINQKQINPLKKRIAETLDTLYGKRSQNRAQKIREKIKSLTTKNITNYISFILKYIGDAQDIHNVQLKE